MPEDAKPAAPSELARVKRFSHRGLYAPEDLYEIIDAALLCHVGYVIDDQPLVTPTILWRRDHHVYWHGSSASRALRTLAKGVKACVTVTHFDGLVFARSGFNHSVNYRSVMAFGVAEALTDLDEKEAALEDFVERLEPGRWPQLRPATTQEMKATSVMRMDLNNASAKYRNGGPNDEPEDMDIPVWAGVVPLRLTAGKPETDARGVVQPVPGALDILKQYFTFREDGGA